MNCACIHSRTMLFIVGTVFAGQQKLDVKANEMITYRALKGETL